MKSIKQKAVKLIAIHLGEETASLYSNFYADKSPEVVEISLKELLESYLGKKITTEELKKHSIIKNV